MKKIIFTAGISTFALFLLVSGGCATESVPSVETTSDEAAPTSDEAAPTPAAPSSEAQWQEVAPGLRMSDDGVTRNWQIEGEEANLVFRRMILRDLKRESEPEKQHFYEQVLEGTDAAIAYARQGGSVRTPRSNTLETTISPITYGLAAHAYAHRSAGYTRAEAYVNINGTIQQSKNSTGDLCAFGCSSSADAQATAWNPASCAATAYAQYGGTGQYAERYTCPSPVCCPRTSCYAGECGYVNDGCGGSLYCGNCGGCGCGCALLACAPE